MQTAVSELVDIETETVRWSAPDTAGRQYPVSTTRTIATVHRQTKRQTDTERNTVHSSVEHSAVSINTDSQTNTKTTIKPKHRMRTFLIIFVLIAVVALETWLLIRHERRNF